MHAMNNNCTRYTYMYANVLVHFTGVGIYLNYVPTVVFLKSSATSTIDQFCFNPSASKLVQKSWRIGTPCPSTRVYENNSKHMHNYAACKGTE